MLAYKQPTVESNTATLSYCLVCHCLNPEYSRETETAMLLTPTVKLDRIQS